MVHVLPLIVSCLSLAWISVCVRFWIKIFMLGRTRWDDWILLLAVMLFSSQCGCVLAMISPKSPDMIPYMFMASYNLSFMTSVCVKTSFALSLNRCFAERWQRLLVTNMTLAFYIYAITRIFVDLFFCGLPGDYAHRDSLSQCKHWPKMLIWWLAASIFNAIVTWIYILLPAVVIWTSRLQSQDLGFVHHCGGYLEWLGRYIPRLWIWTFYESEEFRPNQSRYHIVCRARDGLRHHCNIHDKLDSPPKHIGSKQKARACTNNYGWHVS